MIIEFSPTKRWAIEIKRGLTPHASKGFHLAIQDINAEEKFIVYSGNENYKIGNGIEVISLAEIMNRLKA